jgi:ABC-2 type transport system permease protein
MTNFTTLYFNSFYSIIRREVIRIFRIWKQTLLPPVITQTLYFLIFGTFIGSQIGGFEKVGGYMAYIVPGLVMMAVITNSFQNVVSSFYGAKFQRSIEELLISPTPNWVVLAGYVFGGIFRGLLVGAIVLIISLIFVPLQITNILVVLFFAILTASLFSFFGFFNSLFAKSFDDISIIPTFVLTPLTYLGGVFYSISRLPEFWQKISYFNPIVYMIDGFRYGFYGTADFNVLLSAGILLGLNIALGLLNYKLLKDGYGLRH